MEKVSTTIRLRVEYQHLLRKKSKENGLNPGQYIERLLDKEKDDDQNDT